LPNEAGGNDYIKTFLYWENHEDKRSVRGYVTNVAIKATNLGYRHVDVKQIDGSVVRYRLTGKENSTLASETLSSKEASSRYAVSFINDVNPEDRNNWVAGTTIRVTDLQTKEVMAEKTTFSFEPGLGSTGGFRSPWGFAISCSSIENGSATRFFVDQIVKPSQEK
jgi:hypothetical protein